jgi:Transcriptional regulatory protein, C terminal
LWDAPTESHKIPQGCALPSAALCLCWFDSVTGYIAQLFEPDYTSTCGPVLFIAPLELVVYWEKEHHSKYHSMSLALPTADFAVRLADEGVPLRAIARATKIPSEDLRLQLHEAQLDGRLLELPHDDWPPGFPRDQRALQLSRLVVENKDLIFIAVRQLFRLQIVEVTLLLTLVQHDVMSKKREDMADKTVDVHICLMRKKLQPFGIAIKTVWGYGYQMSVEHRRRTMDIILRRVSSVPIL